ncbi:MAG: GNAT family N-acetyltransferase, partial [Myxococcota bacterium]
MPEFGANGPGFALHDAEVDHMYTAYAKARHAFFVVEEGDQVVGGGGYGPLAGADASVCELRKMYFYPQVRGHGMGRK